VQDVVSWTLDQYALIGTALVLFGFLGLLRGVSRELRSMIGVGVGMLLARVLVPRLSKQINSLYKMGHFAFAVTSSDPGAAWQQAQNAPDLIQTSADLQFVSLLVFVGVVLASYLWGQSRVAGAFSLPSKVLGVVAGGINGFLVAYYVCPILLPESEAVVRVPSGEINAALSSTRTVALVVVAILVILIALGLRASRSPDPRR